MGAPVGSRNALKHGLYAYRAMLNSDHLDERSSLFRALREKELELSAALGGDPSPQEKVIIADSIKNMLYIASLDNYLMNLKSIVRRGKPHPLIATRTQLAAHLRDNLKTLGLKRASRQSSLSDLLEQNGNSDDQSGNGRDQLTIATDSTVHGTQDES